MFFISSRLDAAGLTEALLQVVGVLVIMDGLGIFNGFGLLEIMLNLVVLHYYR